MAYQITHHSRIIAAVLIGGVISLWYYHDSWTPYYYDSLYDDNISWTELHSLENLAIHDIRSSKLLGGVPGYQVVENAYYRDGSFFVVCDDNTLWTDTDLFVTSAGPTRLHTLIPSQEPEQARHMPGSTIYLNDPAAGVNDKNWNDKFYYLIGEVLLGGISALSSVEVNYGDIERADRFVFGHETRWKGKQAMNEGVLDGLFGDTGVIQAGDWQDLSQNWILFDRVVIVDRKVSHAQNIEAHESNKMSIPSFLLPHPVGFFEQYRQVLLARMGITPSDESLASLKKIVYINRRDTTRRMRDEDHYRLIRYFERLDHGGVAKIEVIKLEDVSPEAQIRAVANADILIGVHGSGLTHQLWMRPGGVVMEIFPPDSYVIDHKIVSDVLAHHYTAIVLMSTKRGDQVLSQTEDVSAKGLADGRRAQLDVGRVREIVDHDLTL